MSTETGTVRENEARAAIEEAGGDVHALLPHVLARMDDEDTSAEQAVQDLKRFPAHAAHFETTPTRASLGTPKAKADYIAKNGLSAFLALPRR